MKKETMLRRSFLLALSIAALAVGSLFLHSMPVTPVSAAADFPVAQFTAKAKQEGPALIQFSKDLSDFLAQVTALQSKSTRTAAEIAAMQNSAKSLKSRAPQMKRLIQKIMDELKPGNHLGAPLDRFTEEKLKNDSSSLAEIKSAGGATAILNEALLECDALAANIDGITIKITEKAMVNSPSPVLVPASFAPSAVVFKLRKCWAAKAAITFCTWMDLSGCVKGAQGDKKKCEQALAAQ